MRKQFFEVLVLFFVTHNILAQDALVGIKGGVNFSGLKTKDESGSISHDGNTSIYVGTFVCFGVTEDIHFQPELLYSIEGKETGTITFLNIPLTGKFYLNEELNLQAGPQIGFLVKAGEGTEGLKSTNFSLNIGAGHQLAYGLFFDARYNFGFSNILDDDNSKLQTRNFQLGVSYIF